MHTQTSSQLCTGTRSHATPSNRANPLDKEALDLCVKALWGLEHADAVVRPPPRRNVSCPKCDLQLCLMPTQAFCEGSLQIAEVWMLKASAIDLQLTMAQARRRPCSNRRSPMAVT
jgi:hypothetical protein